METEESRALVARYYASQGNPDALAEILADDVEWVPPASAPIAPAKGRDAVLAAMGGAGGQFFDLATMRSTQRSRASPP